jgi:hypothetical protein
VICYLEINPFCGHGNHHRGGDSGNGCLGLSLLLERDTNGACVVVERVASSCVHVTAQEFGLEKH